MWRIWPHPRLCHKPLVARKASPPQNLVSRADKRTNTSNRDICRWSCDGVCDRRVPGSRTSVLPDLSNLRTVPALHNIGQKFLGRRLEFCFSRNDGRASIHALSRQHGDLSDSYHFCMLSWCIWLTVAVNSVRLADCHHCLFACRFKLLTWNWTLVWYRQRGKLCVPLLTWTLKVEV